MKALLAFILLLLPLIVILACLIGGYLIVRRLSKSEMSARRKWVFSGVVVIVVLLIPTWDVIWGRIQHHQLCSSGAGMFMYKTVEPGPEYLNEDGSLRFIQAKKSYSTVNWKKIVRIEEFVDKDKLRPDYDYVVSNHVVSTFPVEIIKITGDVISVETGDVLGRWVDYLYKGGWFVHIQLGGPVKGSSCKVMYETSLVDLVKNIFVVSQ